MENDKIAHDLAITWVKLAIEKRVEPKTTEKSMVEEYLMVYQEALEKLNALNQTPQHNSLAEDDK